VFSFAVAFLFFFVIFSETDTPPGRDKLQSITYSGVASSSFIPYIFVSIAFPFALSLSFDAVGRLSSDNEILALKASGFQPPYFLPFFSLACVYFIHFSSDYFLLQERSTLEIVQRILYVIRTGLETFLQKIPG
jgi:lipopolysaccharide export LptBFGC system permease protein LptF